MIIDSLTPASTQSITSTQLSHQLDQTMGNNPLPVSLPSECRKAAKTASAWISRKLGLCGNPRTPQLIINHSQLQTESTATSSLLKYYNKPKVSHSSLSQRCAPVLSPYSLLPFHAPASRGLTRSLGFRSGPPFARPFAGWLLVLHQGWIRPRHRKARGRLMVCSVGYWNCRSWSGVDGWG